MTGSGRITGEAFALERLRENPELDYSAVREAAEAAGVSLQPIQYGRARRQLGLTAGAARQPAAADAGDAGEAAESESAFEPAAEPTGSKTAGAAAGRTEQSAGAARRGKGSPDFDFLVAELRSDPHLSYGELRQRSEARGFRIAPIMYGRAKAVLGLVPVRPRGSGKGRKGKAAAPAEPAPTTPRSLKQVESVAADRFAKQLADARSAEDLLAAVKQLDAERRRLRALLERIADSIDEALGYADA